MKNFDGFQVSVLQDDNSGRKYLLSSSVNDRELLVPKIFIDRFEKDQSWRNSMITKYARTIRNKTSDWVYGCGGSKLGIIPEDEPFAITEYENVPRGHAKVREDSQHVYLGILITRGHGSQNCLLAVPKRLWGRYSSDSKWMSEMITKYGSQGVDQFPKSDAPDDLFGFIPESEGDT